MKRYIPQLLAIANGVRVDELGRIVRDLGIISQNANTRRVNVYYYLKDADGTRITNALKINGISFTQLGFCPSSNLHTNALSCGPQTPVTAVKEVAFTLMDHGIPVKKYIWTWSSVEHTLHIIRFNLRNREITTRPLTRSQIEAMTICPTGDWDALENSAFFTMPRLSNGLYIDGSLTGQLDQSGGGLAADAFCSGHGYSGASNYETKLLPDVTSMRLGNNTVCSGQCSVLTRIACE